MVNTDGITITTMTENMVDGNVSDGSAEVSMVNITDILHVDDEDLESSGSGTTSKRKIATTIQIVIFSIAYVWNEGSTARLEISHIDI